MPPGDLVVEDYQFEYEGLLMGFGTRYEIESVHGLDMPNIRTADVTRPLQHGSWSTGPDLMEFRAIEIRVDLVAESDEQLAQMERDLTASTRVRGEDAPLVYKLPAQPKKLVWCRPRRRMRAIDLTYVYNYPRTVLRFEAIDPIIYSADEQHAEVSPLIVTSGLEWDLEFDHGWGTVGGGPTTIVNEGDEPMPPVVRMPGPVLNPIIRNLTTGKQMRLTGEIDAGQFLYLDFKNRLVLLNGEVSRYEMIDYVQGAEWWELVPGPNTIAYNSSTGGATATIHWRSGWTA